MGLFNSKQQIDRDEIDTNELQLILEENNIESIEEKVNEEVVIPSEEEDIVSKILNGFKSYNSESYEEYYEEYRDLNN